MTSPALTTAYLPQAQVRSNDVNTSTPVDQNPDQMNSAALKQNTLKKVDAELESWAKEAGVNADEYKGKDGQFDQLERAQLASAINAKLQGTAKQDVFHQKIEDAGKDLGLNLGLRRENGEALNANANLSAAGKQANAEVVADFNNLLKTTDPDAEKINPQPNTQGNNTPGDNTSSNNTPGNTTANNEKTNQPSNLPQQYPVKNPNKVYMPGEEVTGSDLKRGDRVWIGKYNETTGALEGKQMGIVKLNPMNDKLFVAPLSNTQQPSGGSYQPHFNPTNGAVTQAPTTEGDGNALPRQAEMTA